MKTYLLATTLAVLALALRSAVRALLATAPLSAQRRPPEGPAGTPARTLELGNKASLRGDVIREEIRLVRNRTDPQPGVLGEYGYAYAFLPYAPGGGTDYTQENFRTFRYSSAINDRDTHCRNAYGHFSTYLRLIRDGQPGEAAEKALFYYDAAARRAVDSRARVVRLGRGMGRAGSRGYGPGRNRERLVFRSQLGGAGPRGSRPARSRGRAAPLQ